MPPRLWRFAVMVSDMDALLRVGVGAPTGRAVGRAVGWVERQRNPSGLSSGETHGGFRGVYHRARRRRSPVAQPTLRAGVSAPIKVLWASTYCKSTTPTLIWGSRRGDKAC